MKGITILIVVAAVVAAIAFFVLGPEKIERYVSATPSIIPTTSTPQAESVPTNEKSSAGTTTEAQSANSQGKADIRGIQLGMSVNDATEAAKQHGCQADTDQFGNSTGSLICENSFLRTYETGKDRVDAIIYSQTLEITPDQFMRSVVSQFAPFIENPNCASKAGFIQRAFGMNPLDPFYFYVMEGRFRVCLIRTNGDVLFIANDTANKYILFYGSENVAAQDSGLSTQSKF